MWLSAVEFVRHLVPPSEFLDGILIDGMEDSKIDIGQASMTVGTRKYGSGESVRVPINILFSDSA